MNIENRTVWQKGTFELSRLEDVNRELFRILPLKWVFTYKTNKHGYLQRFKARICVCGDLQPLNGMETYASTLAGRSFRSLMAIVARFDLETLQLDAVNAFTNATLDETVYVWFPPGFSRPGYCLNLRKALYGLRRSPLLWQKSIDATLKSLGLAPLDEDDCVYIGNGIMVFIFVDDVAIVYRKRHTHTARDIVNGLKAAYEMKELGELNVFLGIRIIRDRKKRKLWLSLDNYISKICEEFKVDKKGKPPGTPMATDSLMPNEQQATPQEIYQYQSLVGSLLRPLNLLDLQKTMDFSAVPDM
ncbi:reverse transcriptase domain protein [Colletotrichum tabaci]|uniref:Reverse transcriptase domain protein n=2 Tax=Colletotrichum tabaci TaxID=1209068 RepID=A0AAV9TC66_9PEZI